MEKFRPWATPAAILLVALALLPISIRAMRGGGYGPMWGPHMRGGFGPPMGWGRWQQECPNATSPEQTP